MAIRHMRFIYADPGLRTNAGHHVNTCIAITGELRRRGIETLVFGHRDLPEAEQARLGATIPFRHSTYKFTDGDSIAGWLNAFDTGAKIICEDLIRLGLTASDLVFLNTVTPAVLMGVNIWLGTMRPEASPAVALELGTDSGLEMISAGGQKSLVAPDPRVDARATLYRFAGKRIPKSAKRFRLYYVDRDNAAVFAQLLDHRVDALPNLYHASRPLRPRGTNKPYTVAILGHQQPYKGYALMPAVAQMLLAARSDCRLIIHNSEPAFMRDVHDKMRAVASTTPNVVLDERPLADAEWSELLASIDLVLCPYDPRHYALMPSGVACEAIANGIPIVVPAETSLARLVEQYAGCGEVFTDHAAESVFAAVIRALDKLADRATRAHAAAQRWAQINGPERAVDVILRDAGLG
jgi:glycosyltransferase involved in cell wall biosynthesis